jgi:rhodanese-related sulfurtransferase
MQTMSREKLHQWMDQGQNFVLIETLPEDNFRKEHLPGAINIPVDDERFEDRVREAAPQLERPVIVYCANTECPASPKAARKLDAMGYKEVFDFEAGKQAWKEAGYHMEGGLFG